jgi:hypothetical protein
MGLTYTTTGKGRAIATWGAIGAAAGTFAGALLTWAGAPTEVVVSASALVTAALPPLLGQLLPDDPA